MHDFRPSIAARLNQVATGKHHTSNAAKQHRCTWMFDGDLDGNASASRKIGVRCPKDRRETTR